MDLTEIRCPSSLGRAGARRRDTCWVAGSATAQTQCTVARFQGLGEKSQIKEKFYLLLQKIRLYGALH